MGGKISKDSLEPQTNISHKIAGGRWWCSNIAALRPTCAAALMMLRNERETQKCPFQIFQTILDWAEEHLAPSVEQDFVFSCPFIRMHPQLLSAVFICWKIRPHHRMTHGWCILTKMGPFTLSYIHQNAETLKHLCSEFESR